MEGTKPRDPEPKSHVRRDTLLRIQNEVQERWAKGRVFEAEVKEGQKFFGNFPYPYMNGLLHLGHGFTLSKLEFAAAYHRVKGYNVLFPFGFHCTGMPIKACADKLRREMELYGNPPVFPVEEEVEAEPPTAGDTNVSQQSTGDPTKFKSKKSKAAAKTGPAKFQWQIMRSMGLSDDEIGQFSDASHWLKYFPPLAIEDLKAMGMGVDWRRSFITTDSNPFYDSFVRWQLQTLYDMGKVVKDRRYTIYSPLDGQPCADHDRAAGEGVLPQEYTLIKMEVIAPFTGKLEALTGKKVFLAAATLRPETMAGQTNAWVLPDGNYGAFSVNETDVFIVTSRSASNMSYQDLSKEFSKPEKLLDIKGQDLIGLPLKSPLTSNPVIYALPMLTILTDKGTGIVTSVPSDSPDDYMALQDLKKKPALREKFGVKDEWVLPFEVIPIINIPGFGDVAAEKVCQDLGIKSQNDKEKLAEAKRLTYLKGFTDGVMIIEGYKGQKVQDAKPVIKKMLLETGQAVLYSEPEKKVMSRSGDECVVALTDQWYLTYGEDEWKAKSVQCLEKMELFSDECRHGFEHTLGWLDRWACSRSFGLGTRIPWDPQYLIESLSDSTIYMAYYTVAHVLQGGELTGKKDGPIKPEQMTPEIWDFLFFEKPMPETDISKDLLEDLKSSFNYWYPFDLRVSGKDLINNHLTFCIYNHTALFPQEKWPKGMRTNGHLLLNSEKMSKSTGNFKTIRQAVEEFSADATRFALADAGDTVDDANFVVDTANAAILKLTKELTWMEETLEAIESLRSGPEKIFADRVFENEINIAITVTDKAYNDMLFREALKTGFFDLQLAKDEYRLSCGVSGMHRDLALRFMEVQTILLTPICPHYGEQVWSSILKKDGFAITAGWPTPGAPDYTLKTANSYLQDVITDFRKLILKQQTPVKKGGGKKVSNVSGASKLTSALIYVAEKYGGWQEECLKILQTHYDASTKKFSSDAELMAAIKSSPIMKMGDVKKILGLAMGFIKFKKDDVVKGGAQALELKLSFNEIEVLHENVDLIKRQLGLEEVKVFSVSDSEGIALAEKESSKIPTAAPGSPVALFLSTESANGGSSDTSSQDTS